MLSPLLFNAGLEQAIKRWKQRLCDHGLKLTNNDDERLTHVRFADDLIIYASTMNELTDMLDMLADEFKIMGLELNGSKSKIFSTDPNVFANDNPSYVNTADDMIEIVRANQTHKYLGTSLQGDLRLRGKSNLAYRLKCAWSKFHALYNPLTNKHVAIKLRLRLFDAVVTPTVLYGLISSPLNSHDYDRLAITQRKMLREMVGWVKLPDDEWNDVFRRLRIKIQKATDQYPIRMWADEMTLRKTNLQMQIDNGERNGLTMKVVEWDLANVNDKKRKRGRPRSRWI